MASIPPGTDISKVPIAPNPDGGAPNFENSPSLGPAISGVGISLAIITTCLVAIRVVSDIRQARGFKADDLFCLTALVLAISYTGVMISMESFDRHAWDTPLSVIMDPTYIKKNFVESVLYGPTMFFAKSAILILYLHVFAPKRWLRIAVWVALVLVFVIYWITLPATIIYCMPHGDQMWDASILEQCNVMAKWGLGQGVTNIVADLFIIFTPLPILLKLHQPLKTRLALAAIFATGGLAILASVMTLYFRITGISTNDPTWNSAEVWIFVEIELFLTISVSCMPSLSFFWGKIVVNTRIYASARTLLHSITVRTSGSSQSSRSQQPNVAKERGEFEDSASNLRKSNSYELHVVRGPEPFVEAVPLGSSNTRILESATVDHQTQH